MENNAVEDPGFESSRQFELLTRMVKGIEAESTEDYLHAVQEYNKYTPFDKVLMALGSRVRTTNLPEENPFPSVIHNKKKEIPNFLDESPG
jgi:hypothetical protein